MIAGVRECCSGGVYSGCYYSMWNRAVVAFSVEKEHYCAGDGE